MAEAGAEGGAEGGGEAEAVGEGVLEALPEGEAGAPLRVARCCVALGGGVLTARPELVLRVDSAVRASLGGYAQASFAVGAPALGDQAGPLGALANALDVLEAEAT